LEEGLVARAVVTIVPCAARQTDAQEHSFDTVHVPYGRALDIDLHAEEYGEQLDDRADLGLGVSDEAERARCRIGSSYVLYGGQYGVKQGLGVGSCPMQ
jgi:hypothetical protein